MATMTTAVTATPSKKSNSMENLSVGVYVTGPNSTRPQSIGCDPSTNRPLLADGGLGGDDSNVSLLGYRQTHNSITSNTRWHSDTNITLNPQQTLSQLSVDKTEFILNEDDGVTIHWDIKGNVSAKDWIGLYKTNETHPGKWIDYRNRGVSGSKKGELVWHFDRISSAFSSPETRVCFRYYHGNTGDLRAVTESILVRNLAALSTPGVASLQRLYSVDSEADIVHLAIQDIEAAHVRKGMFFNPDPYVKLRVEPGQDRTQPVLAHHYKDTRTSVCENTTEPRWTNEIFHFMALPSDDLFMKVKDRFTTSRPTLLRFLGQVSIPIKQVMEKARLGLTMSCSLSGRSPHDHVCGSLVFKPTIIPYDATNSDILNSERHRSEGNIDSSVENALDSSSAVVVLSDSTMSSSDEEGGTPLQRANSRPTIRQLTHTYSGTSGDSSVDGSALGEGHNSNFTATCGDGADGSSPHLLRADSAQDESIPSMEIDSSYLSIPDPDQRPGSPDPLTAYINEAEESRHRQSRLQQDDDNGSHEVEPAGSISAGALDDTSTISVADNMTDSTGVDNITDSTEVDNITDSTGVDNITNSTGVDNITERAEINNTTDNATDSAEVDNRADSTEVDNADDSTEVDSETTGMDEPSANVELESSSTYSHSGATPACDVGHHVQEGNTTTGEGEDVSLPPPDFPAPSIPQGAADIQFSIGSVEDMENGNTERETGADSSSGLAADNLTYDTPPVVSQLNPSLTALKNKSSSEWSLENHAGSRENIADDVTDSGGTAAADTNHCLAEDITSYMNMSALSASGSVAKSNVMSTDSGAATTTTTSHTKDRREKIPLPQPRTKTLAEQLDNLQVISVEAPTFHPASKPPELPQKAIGKNKCKSRDGASSVKSTTPSNSITAANPTNTVTATSTNTASGKPPLRRPLESEGSLEMPAGPAPLPPSGAKPKKPVNHQHHKEVAQQYGSLGSLGVDVVDARPKLKPRKTQSDRPPQLPPRRQRADGSTTQTHNDLLDDVFEPQFSSRQHHRHHKTKVRTAQTSSTESEEARVAAEVANAAASLPRPHHMKSESIEVEEALPAGWEARLDAHGRVFYIDHHNKSTTWDRPKSVKRGQAGSHAPLQRVPSISNTDRRNMDHRYRNIQRMASVDTISERSLSPPKHQAPVPPASSAVNSEVGAQASSGGSSRTGLSHSTPASQAKGGGSSAAAAATSSSSTAAAPSTSSSQPKANTSSATDAETLHLQEVIRNSPAVKFLTRTDFFSLVQYSDEAQTAYTSNSALKHMVHKIRKEPKNFHKYWHNKDLVNFLNMFVNKDIDLPGNWQMKHDKTGKVFYLDHSTKTTTFIDPRLPTEQPLLIITPQMPLPLSRYREREDDPSSGDADLVPTAYNQKVVLFLRQPNVLRVLQNKYPLLKKNEGLKNKLNIIIADGTQALRKYRNHVELTILLSMFENEIMSFVPAHLKGGNHQEGSQTSPKGSPAMQRRHIAPYKEDFQDKYRTLLRKLEAKGIGQGPGRIKMRVRRDHILEDSFKKIMSYSKKDLQKNKLLISFLGEEGLDYGGPAREFFFLLSRELFNPYYGLFEYSANDTYTVQISPMSTFVDNAAEWFRFAGRMIGLCIVHQYLMDSFFTRPFYKMLLKEECSLNDLESLDAEFYQSLLWIIDNDISDAGLDLTFSVDEEVFGQITERELKPNGSNISVTNKNKSEYVNKMVMWRIDRGVNEQKEHLLKGFHEVIEPKLVSMFDAKDLELVIAGTAEIDIMDWRNNTEYRSGYYDTHPIVNWFWEVIESFDNEKRLRLLQFVTGTSSIPFEGFSALRGSNGPRKFTIEKWGKPESLPRAHTCFNRLDLPTYTTKETMQEKLMTAISETSTFGIE